MRRSARDDILEWCDRLDTEGAVPAVLDAFARHGFSDRDTFAAPLENPDQLPEAEAELHDACDDVRRDQAWEYQTQYG